MRRLTDTWRSRPRDELQAKLGPEDEGTVPEDRFGVCRDDSGPLGTERILHGKEGVDGSSPSEGLLKGQQMDFFVSLDGVTGPLEPPETRSPRSDPNITLVLATWLEQSVWLHRAPPSNGGRPP
jgi:hypothetical protein